MLRSAAVVFLAFGCSSSSATDFDHGKNDTSIQGGTERLSYPAAPYGTVENATIQDFRFLGWHQPEAVNYDETRIDPVSLAQFYGPNIAHKLRFLVITSTAVWCAACKLEYEDFASGRVDEYHAKGVEFLGALFEDNDSNPAKPSDLNLWATSYKVNFPFVLDPALKLGVFFDREATPMEMVVDLSTMQVRYIATGWATSGPASLWTVLDQLLGG